MSQATPSSPRKKRKHSPSPSASPSAIPVTSLLSRQTELIASLTQLATCNICLDLLADPFILSCGHEACQACLLSWFQRGPDAGDGLVSASPLPSASSSPIYPVPSLPSLLPLQQPQQQPQQPQQPQQQPQQPRHNPQELTYRQAWAKLTCPQCRAAIRQSHPPVQMFTSAAVAALLRGFSSGDGSGGSNGASHSSNASHSNNAGHSNNTDIQKQWDKLFPPNRTPARYHARRGIEDTIDGVFRCDVCAFEIVDGFCSNCGESYPDSDAAFGRMDDTWFSGSEIDSDSDEDLSTHPSDNDFIAPEGNPAMPLGSHAARLPHSSRTGSRNRVLSSPSSSERESDDCGCDSMEEEPCDGCRNALALRQTKVSRVQLSSDSSCDKISSTDEDLDSDQDGPSLQKHTIQRTPAAKQAPQKTARELAADAAEARARRASTSLINSAQAPDSSESESGQELNLGPYSQGLGKHTSDNDFESSDER